MNTVLEGRATSGEMLLPFFFFSLKVSIMNQNRGQDHEYI